VRIHKELLHLFFLHRSGRTFLQHFGRWQEREAVFQRTSRTLHCCSRDMSTLHLTSRLAVQVWTGDTEINLKQHFDFEMLQATHTGGFAHGIRIGLLPFSLRSTDSLPRFWDRTLFTLEQCVAGMGITELEFPSCTTNSHHFTICEESWGSAYTTLEQKN
jgi:hypothetical protein